MKHRKRICICALCVTSVLAFALSFTAHVNQFPQHARHSGDSQATVALPATYIATSALRAAMASDAMSMESSTQGTSHQNASPFLPPVQEFTLTPPDPNRGIAKTLISVRFGELQAEALPGQIPVTLGKQQVILRRSTDDGRVFSTQVDFDWVGFEKEQQQRKEAASRGATVPIFEGRHFLGVEKMQFVDPTDIESALQSHNPIQFQHDILESGTSDVFPDHELMIVDPKVVEDVGPHGNDGRTFDACLAQISQPTGNPNGAWTFKTLFMSIANTSDPQVAEQVLANLLANWNNDSLQINGFPVHARPGMGALGQSGLLKFWPPDSNNTSLPSLANAPVHLDAIVNRIDLGDLPGQTHGGELRFVFGVTSDTTGQCVNGGKTLFNIILEFQIPSSIQQQDWANKWDAIKLLNFDDSQTGFMNRLQTDITDIVVAPGACGGQSCLHQIRTNELSLQGGDSATLWEQRQFALVNGALQEVEVSMTPDGNKFNTTGAPPCGMTGFAACDTSNPTTLANWINQNQSAIDQTQGVQPVVGLNFPTVGIHPFLGGSAFNGGVGGNANAFWNTNGLNTDPVSPDLDRIYFSENTCNGCHGKETKTGFQQVVNRSAGFESGLSPFLLGCTTLNHQCSVGSGQCSVTQENLGQNGTCFETVPDPNPSFSNSVTTNFGDLARRVTTLKTILNPSNGPLLTFIRPHVGVH